MYRSHDQLVDQAVNFRVRQYELEQALGLPAAVERHDARFATVAEFAGDIAAPANFQLLPDSLSK